MKSFRVGFTIIETMLFLAITGVLVAGVLVGAGTSINTQRYSDSVRSLQNKIKKAYSDVMNVSSDRSVGKCGWYASEAETYSGQSDCLIMGKYITRADSASNTITISNVVGYYYANAVNTATKVPADFQGYSLAADDTTAESYSPEWESSAYMQDNSRSDKFSILILRSPTSGSVWTFVDYNHSYVSFQQSLVSTDNIKQAKLCVDSNGLSSVPKMAVQIKAGATSASDVEILGSNSGC